MILSILDQFGGMKTNTVVGNFKDSGSLFPVKSFSVEELGWKSFHIMGSGGVEFHTHLG